MESKRRSFLKNASILAGTVLVSRPLSALADVNKTIKSLANGHHLTVYHTGNLKGHLESNAEQLGGLKEIHKLIERQEHSGLILDVGNFMGKVPAYEVISQMNRTGYHAAAIGANELSGGQEELAALLPDLGFPLVNCNYKFSNPVLASGVKTYVIIQFGNLKIGITGLAEKVQVEGVRFQDSYLSLNKVSAFLKTEKKCDFVICLSNLNAEDKSYSNIDLAGRSAYVDFIIGKNGTKVLSGAMISRNSKKEEVVLSQVGYDGIILGKTSFKWNDLKEKSGFSHQYLVAGLPLKNNEKQAGRMLHKMATANA